MTRPAAVVLPAALVLSAVATAALGGRAWRDRSRPGALPFVGLMVAVTTWTVSYLVALTVHPGGPLLWERMQWFGIAFVPVFFLAFAMDYLGHEALTVRFLAALSIPPLVTIGLVWTGGAHDLLWEAQRTNVVAGLTITEHTFGTWYWFNLVYAYGLIAVGSYLLVRLAIVSERLYLDQSLSLVVGVVVPLLANALSVFGRTPVAGIDLTPFALTVTGVAFGNALFRYRLFELAPATWQIGRETIVGSMDDAVVITDADRTIVYCNDEAESVFDVTVADVVGDPASRLVDLEAVDFDAPDAMGETEIDGRIYEVRASEIVDRHERDLGYALVFNDITERKRREEELKRQRDRLQLLDRLNAVIRGVNRELVTADSREAAVTAVRGSLTESALYDAVWFVDDSTAAAPAIEGDGATVDAGATDGGPVETGFSSARDAAERLGGDGVTVEGTVDESEPGRCVSVPIVYGKTVYGALVLFTTRPDAFGDRELAVLDELGESVGHAINAAEKERLLVADTAIELTFDVSGTDGVLANASTAADCTVEIAGTVAGDGGDLVVYLRAADADAETVRDALADDDRVEAVRIVSETEETILAATLSGGSILFPLREYGATLESARAESGDGTVVVTVSPDADVRTAVARVGRDYPAAEMTAKRRRESPIESGAASDGVTEDLTDRQLETLEVAYAAGYFEWPRDSTAEEVAESMGISAPTLHSHLRKAQNRVLRDVLAGESEAIESGAER